MSSRRHWKPAASWLGQKRAVTSRPTLRHTTALLIPLILLTGCWYWPGDYIQVPTDPSVLHGRFSGQLEGYPVAAEVTGFTLELAASYVSFRTYSVSGVLRLPGEPPHQLAGLVEAGELEGFTPVRPQTPAPRRTTLNAYVPALGVFLCGHRAAGGFEGVAELRAGPPGGHERDCSGTYPFAFHRAE